MDDLRKGALNDACVELAKEALSFNSAVSADLVETLAARFQEQAMSHLEFIQGQGRDPNLLTRAVYYLVDAHGYPDMASDPRLFRTMLDFAVELAVPNTGLTERGRSFLADVEEGLDQSR